MKESTAKMIGYVSGIVFVAMIFNVILSLFVCWVASLIFSFPVTVVNVAITYVVIVAVRLVLK